MSKLLAMPPFSKWQVARSIEEDFSKREVWYEFIGHGVEVICDADERIRTVFLHPGGADALSDVAFSLSRQQVLDRFGSPLRSGSATHIPGLGNRGAWDQFALDKAVLHVQYQLDQDEIEMITLMRPDAVP